jgi:two-component system sensor histidine kinase AlgZ
MKTDAAGGERSLYLPDFCTSRAALVLILIVELTAFVLTLARQSAQVDFWADLARTSVFLLWIGLAGAALLCLAKQQLVRLSVAQGSLVVFALIAAVIALVSGCALFLGRSDVIYGLGLSELFPRDIGAFLLRNLSIGLVITALTFASLTRSNPALAEQAVQDLADLFRANLNEQRNVLLLEEELEVAHIYQRIEELRLGERLRVDWKVDGLPRDALVPGLMLQPLLENAIYHGIEPRPDGGIVTVTGEVTGRLITIVVRNPVGASKSQRGGGHQLALANIRERLALMYGERALVKSGRFDLEYIVTLRFPYVERPEMLVT